MENRRLFLKSIGMSALLPLFGGMAQAGVTGALPAGAVRTVAAGTSGEVFIVNGWVLTRADLVALGLHA